MTTSLAYMVTIDGIPQKLSNKVGKTTIDKPHICYHTPKNMYVSQKSAEILKL